MFVTDLRQILSREGTLLFGKLSIQLSRCAHMKLLEATANLLQTMHIPQQTQKDRVRNVADQRHFGVRDPQGANYCGPTAQQRCRVVQKWTKELTKSDGGPSVIQELMSAYRGACPDHYAAQAAHCGKMGITENNIGIYPLIFQALNTGNTARCHTDRLGRPNICDLVVVMGQFNGGHVNGALHSWAKPCCTNACACMKGTCEGSCDAKKVSLTVQSGQMYLLASKSIHHSVDSFIGTRCSLVLTIRARVLKYKPYPSICDRDGKCRYCSKQPHDQALATAKDLQDYSKSL